MTTRTITHNNRTTTATTYRRRSKLDSMLETAAVRMPNGKALNTILVIIRESDKNGHKEFLAMMEKVFTPRVQTLPGASKMLSYGSSIMARDNDGQTLRDTLGAEPYYVEGTREVLGWLFNIDGTLFFMVLNSAAKAKVSIDDDYNMTATNAFTKAAASIVLKYQVTKLITGPLSRIIRVAKLAAPLRDALITTKATVESTVEGRLYMGDDAGVDNWDIWALFIERSYRQTVSGLTNGKHNRLLTGRWPGSEKHLPAMGYKYKSKDDATVVPDLTKLEMVKDFLTWCAQPESELSNEEIADLLTKKYSWGSYNLKKRTAKDDDATAAEARHPGRVVINALVTGLDVWASGKYLYTTSIPWVLQTENLLEGIRPYVVEIGTARKLAIEIDFHNEDLPDGRWVAPEIIEAAGRRLKGVAAGNALQDRGTDIKPLSGLVEWFEDDRQWTLSAAYGNHYALASRPVSEAVTKTGARAGWLKTYTGDPVAVLRTSEVHKAIASSVIEALETGVKVSRTGQELSLTEDALDANEIVSEIERVKQAIDRKALAIDIALEKKLTTQATQYMEDQEEKHKELRALELALSQCHSQQENRRPIKAQQVMIGEVIEVLASLYETEIMADPSLRAALQKVIHRVTAKVAEDGTHVVLNTWVRLMTDDGSAVFGPVESTVRDRRRKHHTDRHENIARLILLEGLRPAEAAEVSGYGVRTVRARVNKQLAEVVPSMYLRTAIVDCPIKETKLVIWHMMKANQEGVKFKAPEGMDPAFVKLVQKTYSDPEATWTVSWAADSHTAPRRALAFIAEAGEDGAKWTDVLKMTAEAFDPSMVDYFRTEMLKGKSGRYLPVVERGKKFHNTNPDRRVHLKACPFCHTQTLTHVLHVPEVVGGMICTSCRKAPGTPSVAFPEAYMALWCGPRGLGKGRQPEHNDCGTYEAS